MQVLIGTSFHVDNCSPTLLSTLLAYPPVGKKTKILVVKPIRFLFYTQNRNLKLLKKLL